MTTALIKQEHTRSKGISLIVVPCWWDGKPQSLKASIAFQRPDLTFDDIGSESPIPLNPPPRHFAGGSIPDVGELMLASFTMNQNFNQTISTENAWWLGEKYDGIRCCWNPNAEKLYNRSGGEVGLSKCFLDSFCDTKMFLDCELWIKCRLGREYFSETQKILQSNSDNIDWSYLRTITFDEPPVLTSNDPFEDRYQHLIENLSPRHPFIIVAFRNLSIKPVMLKHMMQHILEDGGEGLILRKPCSYYFCGRSSELVKLKASRGDQEALVLEATNNSALLQPVEGESFQAPTEGVFPVPKRGDIVTFVFQNVSQKATPINPKILRIRTDVTWEYLLQNIDVPQVQHLNDVTSRVLSLPRKPHGFWVSDRGRNMRSVFESIARSKGMDPLRPETWYSISNTDLHGLPGAMAILHAYNGSVIHALLDLFPDIKFDESKFSILRREYWNSIPNRRRFFEEYANEKNFDPKVASNWYTISSDIQAARKASSVLMRYGGSIIAALIHLFPEIGLDSQKFDLQTYWKHSDNRRKVFENIAKKNNLDPLIPESWYEMPHKQILATKSIPSVLAYHKSSVIKALVSLFPEVSFDEIKFTDQYARFWREPRNRRLFLETFAKDNKFDPLISDNWRPYTKESIVPSKTASIVFSYHEGSLIRALRDLFPEIKMEGKYWSRRENRRKLMLKFAAKHKFDPLIPSNWYSISTDKLLSFQGGNFVLHYYKNSVIKALLDLFPDIGLEPLNFNTVPQHFWKDVKNRKAFFDNFAKSQSFDPLVAEHWYNLDISSLSFSKKYKSVMEFYGGNLSKALLDVYPDIGLDIDHFSSSQKSWKDPKKRREFFENFAREHQFDPFNPSNWYNLRNEIIMSAKFGRSVMFYYNNSISKAIQHLFPEIDIDESKFNFLPSNHWSGVESRKRLLEEFAEEKGFDPLNPENWYSLQPPVIMGYKKAASIFSHYNMNVAEALVHLFPNIGFSKSRFASLPAWRKYALQSK